MNDLPEPPGPPSLPVLEGRPTETAGDKSTRRYLVPITALLTLIGGFSAGAMAAKPAVTTPMEAFIRDQQALVLKNCVMLTQVTAVGTAEEAQALANNLGQVARLNGAEDGTHYESVIGRLTLPDGQPAFVVAAAARVCLTPPQQAAAAAGA